MALFENCPNCGAKTFDGGFCSSCKSKQETIFWETGISHGALNTRQGDLDRKLFDINLRNTMRAIEDEKKRKLEFFTKLDK
jgi:hypothetical protein